MKKILLMLPLLLIVFFLQAQVYTLSNPEIVPLELVKLSAPLTSIPVDKSQISFDAPRPLHENPSLELEMEITNPEARPAGADPLRQLKGDVRDSSSTQIEVLSNWEGQSANIEPSDNCLAVGPAHVMQLTNNSVSSIIRIWDKDGNALVDGLKVKDFSGINDCGDPNITYDEVADRWVILLLGSCSSAKLEICVSETEDPTGSWYVYTFTTSGGFPDYPKLSTWGNAYFITTNSNSPTIWAVNRADVLDGLPIGTVQKFSLSSLPAIGFQAASPVNFTGSNLPPEGAPAIMLRVADDAWGSSVDTDHLEIFEVNIDWDVPANSTISGPYNLNTSDYNSAMCGFNSFSCIPQPGTNIKLDPLANIVMDKVQYRNFANHQSIVCTHGVNADGNGLSGVRWYELRKDNGDSTWHVFQEGTYSPDNVHRWMSSISINDDGTIALGYNISNSTTYPGMAVTGRAICDDANLMTVTETVTAAGTNHNNSNRYGDYNNLLTDPADGSFWFTANYNPSTQWSTNVTHFTISNCLATGLASLNGNTRPLKISPVPASDKITVTVNASEARKAKLQLLNLTGHATVTKSLTLKRGENQIALDILEMQDGFYIIKIQYDEGVQTARFMIQHE